MKGRLAGSGSSKPFEKISWVTVVGEWLGEECVQINYEKNMHVTMYICTCREVNGGQERRKINEPLMDKPSSGKGIINFAQDHGITSRAHTEKQYVCCGSTKAMYRDLGDNSINRCMLKMRMTPE